MLSRYVCLLTLVVLLPLHGEDIDPHQLWGSLVLRAHRVDVAGDAVGAIEIAKQALPIAQSFGPNDWRVATTYHMIGTAYRDTGNCSEARANYLRAVEIWKKQPEPSKHNVFSSTLSVVNLACECLDFAGAEKLYHQYGKVLEANRSDALDDARLAVLKAALARGKNHYPEAEQYLREALNIYQKMPNPPAKDIAQAEGSLGAVIERLGRPQESLEHQMKGLAILEEIAPKQPGTVASINNVGCALADLGRGAEAAKYLERALQLATEQFGENNRITGQIMLNYSRVLHENKEAPAADAMLKRGKSAFREAALKDRSVIDIQDLKMGLR